jgi:transcriptional regulator with XRE-family HTH domain
VKRRSIEPAEVLELRSRLGLSQIDFAERFPITERTVRHWEHGTREPRRLAVRRFLEIKREQDEKEGKRPRKEERTSGSTHGNDERQQSSAMHLSSSDPPLRRRMV